MKYFTNLIILTGLLLLTNFCNSQAQHFEIVAVTDRSHALLVNEATLDFDDLDFSEPLAVDDEIALFDPDGVCAGVGIVEDPEERIGIALWGDDEETDEDEGFEEDDEFLYRVWRAESEREIDEINTEVIQGEERWDPEELTVIVLHATGEFEFAVEDPDIDFGVIDMIDGEPEIWQTTYRLDGEFSLDFELLKYDGDSAWFEVEFDAEVVEPESVGEILITFPVGDYEPDRTYGLGLYLPYETGPFEVMRMSGIIGAPQFQVERDTIDFGSAAVDSNQYRVPFEILDSLYLENIGTATLRLDNFQFGDPSFSLKPETPETIDIKPEQHIYLPILFNPEREWEYDSYLTIVTNTFFTPQIIEIRLLGEGVIPISVDSETQDLPVEFRFLPAYPNPFNSTLTIKYDLPRTSDLSLSIHDLSGRLVEMLFSGEQTAGSHEYTWDASGASSGVYLIRMDTGELAFQHKVVLIR